MNKTKNIYFLLWIGFMLYLTSCIMNNALPDSSIKNEDDLVEDLRSNEKMNLSAQDIYGSWDVYYYEFSGQSDEIALKAGGELIVQNYQYEFMPDKNLSQAGLGSLKERLLFVRQKNGSQECEWTSKESNFQNGDIVAICTFISEPQIQKFNVVFFEDENQPYLELREVIKPAMLFPAWKIQRSLSFSPPR